MQKLKCSFPDVGIFDDGLCLKYVALLTCLHLPLHFVWQSKRYTFGVTTYIERFYAGTISPGRGTTSHRSGQTRLQVVFESPVESGLFPFLGATRTATGCTIDS